MHHRKQLLVSLAILTLLVALPFPATAQEPEGGTPIPEGKKSVSVGGILDGLFQRREGSSKPRKKPQPAPSREQSNKNDNRPALFSVFNFGAKRVAEQVDSLAEGSDSATGGNSAPRPAAPVDQPPPLPMVRNPLPAQPVAMTASRPVPLAERLIAPPSAPAQPVARPARPTSTTIPPHALLV
jgi:hypothetical protein